MGRLLTTWQRIQSSCPEEIQWAKRKFRTFNELRNKSHEKEYFIKEIENLKKNQKEVLELKNSINAMRNALTSIVNRADHKEEGIIELKDRNLEMIQVKERDK